jgi:hypothetical protein
MVNPNRFYTYAYLREDKTPYYIGKGKGYRLSNRKKKDIKPPKDKSRIIFLKKNLTEEEAFKHEIYMIAVFGRKDLGTGILLNRTNGGDGCSGLIHSPETKAKMSYMRKGENNPLYGKTHSPDTKQKMRDAKKNIKPETREKQSAAQKGRTHSPETRAKMSASQKGKNHPNYGKTLSPETRAKQSAAQKGEKSYNYGKTLSPETKAKLSSALKGEKNPNYGKIWITNGNTSRRIYPNEIIPEGFGKGRTLHKPAQDPTNPPVDAL